jgi:hypothetical protein
MQNNNDAHADRKIVVPPSPGFICLSQVGLQLQGTSSVAEKRRWAYRVEGASYTVGTDITLWSRLASFPKHFSILHSSFAFILIYCIVNHIGHTAEGQLLPVFCTCLYSP